ncbi:MAG TPA: hypothetical protein VM571_11945 [Noviherbaspirillum sp.]|nr:hypothetical protein [Noviherbaspirillum sp.]
MVVGDIQQTQDGVDQTDAVNIGNVTAGVASTAVGDGRSVTVENGQMVLHRDGVSTITIPAAR